MLPVVQLDELDNLHTHVRLLHDRVGGGLLNRKGKDRTPSANTIKAYVDALWGSYFFYEIKRFDIKGNKYLRTLGNPTS